MPCGRAAICVLGKAESAGALADYLAPADPDLKLYRRVGETLLPPLLLQPIGDFSPPRPGLAHAHSGQAAERTDLVETWRHQRRTGPVGAPWVEIEPGAPGGTPTRWRVSSSTISRLAS